MDFYQCKKCDRKYAYVVTDMHVPGGKDREYAICPYCKEPVVFQGDKRLHLYIQTGFGR